MAIYRLPPSPFIGGRQPLDSRDLSPAIEAEVNDPPPKGNPAILLSILIAWQPFLYQPQKSPYFPAVSIEEVVPFTRKDQNYSLDYIHPIQSRKLNPSLLNVEENDPPFGQRIWLSTTINSWEPLPPQHRRTNKVLQESNIIIWLWRRIG